MTSFVKSSLYAFSFLTVKDFCIAKYISSFLFYLLTKSLNICTVYQFFNEEKNKLKQFLSGFLRRRSFHQLSVFLIFKMSDKELIKKMKRIMAESFDSEIVMKENDITLDDLDHFRDLLKSCEQVPKALMNKAILLTLVACRKNFDKSVNLIRNYCMLKKDTPEFFHNRDVLCKEVQNSLDNQIHVSLPPTPDNCNLIFHKMINCDPKSYIFDDMEKAFTMTVGKWDNSYGKQF